MRSVELYVFSGNRQQSNSFLKMIKMRTIALSLMIIASSALILSLTDAYPAAEPTANSNVTGEDSESKNNTRLVVTHIVKTIEFQVGLLEDDGDVDGDGENITELTNPPEYVETDIKLLNVNLLRELLDQVTEDDASTAKRPEEGAEVEGDDSMETDFGSGHK